MQEKNDFADKKSELVEDFSLMCTGEIEKNNECANKVNMNYKNYMQAKSTFALTIDLYDSYIDDLKMFGNIVITKYRENNKTERSEDCPAFFDKEIDINLSPAEVELGFEDRTDLLASENENTEKIIPRLTDNFNELKTESTEALNEINYL